MKTGMGKVFLRVLLAAGLWTGMPGAAPAAAPGADKKPGAESSLSPAARRAQLRDSLRLERLKQREALPAASAAVPAPSGSPNAVSPSGAGVSASSTGSPALPPGPGPSAGSSATASPPPPSLPTPLPSVVPSGSAAAASAAASTASDTLPISGKVMVEALNVRDAEIRDVLQGLGSQYGVNIVMAKDVTGPISVNFHKMPLRDALRVIAEENGYRLSTLHGAIRVEKKPEAPPPPPPAPNFTIVYRDRLLSVDVQKIPVEQVVRRLVEVTGRNITLDRDARGEVTAFFNNLDLDKGLRVIADNNGFLIRQKDGITTWIPADLKPVGGAGAGGAEGGGAAASRLRISVKDSLVSLDVVNAPVEDVVAGIAAQIGISTVLYGQVKGSVTMKVTDVRVDKALQYLFRGTESTFWVNNGIYFIGPQSMQVSNNSQLIALKHLKADEVIELLPPTLIQGAQLKVVKSLNAIMALGPYDVLAGIGQYISQVDLPVPQILIEALVVDVDADRIRQYGLDMFLGNARRTRSSEYLYPNIDQVFNAERSRSIVGAIPGIRDIVSLPSNFVAKVEALEQEKVLKIRSRPQIATLNGSEASITVGQTQYFLLKSETDVSQVTTVSSKVTERFEKIDANVTLTVTPFVTGKGEITCEIVPDFSEPEGSFDSRTPPTLNRRVLKSKVRLRDGETIVLGGLVKESVNRTNRQFPFLGSIPVIGWLFKNNSSTTSRSQLMIFVTPHVYYGSDSKVDPDKYLKKTMDLSK